MSIMQVNIDFFFRTDDTTSMGGEKFAKRQVQGSESHEKRFFVLILVKTPWPAAYLLLNAQFCYR